MSSAKIQEYDSDEDNDNTDAVTSNYDDIDDMDYELPSSGPSGSTSQGNRASMQSNPQTHVISPEEMSKYKHYQIIYPLYIDSAFAHRNGERRVVKARSVKYPKAQEIAQVCGVLYGLYPVLEMEKTHPKTWENPGRVRVLLKEKDGKLANAQVPTKQALLNKLADGIRMLRASPGFAKAPYPILDKLPYHSPAISHGVYEEALKGGGQMNQMMKGMLGSAAGGAASPDPKDEEEQRRKVEEKELAEKQKMAKLKALNKQGRRMQRR